MQKSFGHAEQIFATKIAYQIKGEREEFFVKVDVMEGGNLRSLVLSNDSK
jgi:hypothetical protein